MNVLSGLLALLRGFKLPNIGDLKSAGVEALKEALRAQLSSQGQKLQAKALKRLETDGVVAKLPQAGPFKDKDGVEMSGRQLFVHEALFAIPRAIAGGGTAADFIRDDHFASWGLTEADTLLAGVTDGAEAMKRVFDRLREQFS